MGDSPPAERFAGRDTMLMALSKVTNLGVFGVLASSNDKPLATILK
jgi:hypothetical protein